MPTPSSDDAFAEVKAKVDLVKIVQEHVRLTKRNKDFWGLCPFHQEDSPSFKVNAQMQSWYCFGCERHGDVFTFVELIEKTDKRGALQLLAERAGVELKKLSPEQKERSDSRRRLLAMLKLSAQYYEYVLWSMPAGEPGRRLLERRKVEEETARRFQLGYAPAGRGFAEYLRAKKRSLADAQEAGLMRRDGTDFFAERLVVPIRDERGQPLAFTARTVRQDEQRKYINSPETPAYVKGRVIFGLDLARDEIARRGHAVVMEGQFDVITAHGAGIQNAVASSGTALTDDQVRLLKRFTDELLLGCSSASRTSFCLSSTPTGRAARRPRRRSCSRLRTRCGRGWPPYLAPRTPTSSSVRPGRRPPSFGRTWRRRRPPASSPEWKRRPPGST